jgi:MFS family permease
VPIQAYDLLRDEQAVSLLHFFVGIAGLFATLSAPILFQLMARRWVYTAGALVLIAASACLATGVLVGQAAGMFLRILGASTLSIALNLYIMDFIPKQKLVEAESLRFALSTLSWTAGPGLGVWLYVNVGPVAPYLWSAFWSALLIAIFWGFRLSGSKAIRPGSGRPGNPIANIRRFVRQPRMRLAWLIAFGRSCYWTTFYIYAPILMVATGQGKLAGGLIVSVGNAFLIFAVGWGKLGYRLGVRAVVVASFAAMAATAIAGGIAGANRPWIAALLLLAGINFAVALDAIGSTPFLRAVHPYERPQMTAVYRTNLDLSDLLPPFVYALILAFTGLGGVFVALGLFSAVCAVVSWRHLPRSM